MVLSLPTGDFDENSANYEFASYPVNKVLVLRTPETKKMKKMEGVTSG